jgi:hypothetical protein
LEVGVDLGDEADRVFVENLLINRVEGGDQPFSRAGVRHPTFALGSMTGCTVPLEQLFSMLRVADGLLGCGHLSHWLRLLALRLFFLLGGNGRT